MELPSKEVWRRFLALEPEPRVVSRVHVSPWVRRKRKPKPGPIVPQPEFDWILEAAEEEFGVSRIDLLSERRDRKVARARQTVMWVARKHTTLSLPRIAYFLRRDHTTVIHAVETIDRLMETDSQLKDRVAGVAKRANDRLQEALR